MIFFLKIEIIFKMGAFFGFENETFFWHESSNNSNEGTYLSIKKRRFFARRFKEFKIGNENNETFFFQFSHFFVDD